MLVVHHLKLGARYYNPTTGRFTQPDPAALYGGYAYANDNPTNLTDPLGLDAVDKFLAVLGVIAVAAAVVLEVSTPPGWVAAGLEVTAWTFGETRTPDMVS